MVTLILGGSGSGKSAFAEDFITKENIDCKKYYLATMKTGDDPETKKRIERHRMMRKEKGFLTIEQPYDIWDCLDRIDRDSVILLEDLSNLLANEMFLKKRLTVIEEPEVEIEEEIEEEIENGITALSNHSANLVIVSNNIFEDGIEYDEETKRYMKALGELNRRIAGFSNEVYEVVCGIPIMLKQ